MAEMTPEERAHQACRGHKLAGVSLERAVAQEMHEMIFGEEERTRAAVEAEREACAKVAEDYAAARKQPGLETQRAIAADSIARAIRARAKQQNP